MGKFYELFHMDAMIAVNELGIIFMKVPIYIIQWRYFLYYSVFCSIILYTNITTVSSASAFILKTSAFFHAKLGLNVYPRVINRPLVTLYKLTRCLVDQSPSGPLTISIHGCWREFLVAQYPSWHQPPAD